MNTEQLHSLIDAWRDDALTPEQAATLSQCLRESEEARRVFQAEAQMHGLLHCAVMNSIVEQTDMLGASSATRGRARIWLQWRPLAAAAAGIVLGMFCTSIVWAVSSPRATAERLFSLINGSFDEARLGHGFPRQTGVWSGDEAAITDGRLRFIKPEADEADPSGHAISCDVFQLVDLRPLRRTGSSAGDAVLELSARFADERPSNTNPSVTFFCQLYLFQGDPKQMHQSWPQSITEALASGSAQVTTLGTDAKGARQLTARCLVPAEADLAVVQIAARPNLRPAKLDSLFADDVTITLKTSPELPVRIVQR